MGLSVLNIVEENIIYIKDIAIITIPVEKWNRLENKRTQNK